MVAFSFFLVAKATFSDDSLSCANCGEKLWGDYCSRCGEKMLESREFSIRHFLGQLFDELTSVDSKLLRSLWLLLRKPGFLTGEYFAGRRVRYVKPLQLFFLINVVYFFAQPLTGFNTYNSNLALQTHQNPYTNGFVNRLLTERLSKRGITYEDYQILYNAKSENIAKLMIILMVPLFAGLFQILHSPQKRFYYEHLVFNLHLFAFQLILMILPVPLCMELFAVLVRAFNKPGLMNELTLSLFVNGILMGYVYLAMRRFYQGTKFRTFLRALTLTALFLPVIQLYRFLLFLVTFALT